MKSAQQQPSSSTAQHQPSTGTTQRISAQLSELSLFLHGRSKLSQFPLPSGSLTGLEHSGMAPCKGDTAGLLERYPVTASGFHLIGKETERGWEQAEDISTLLPSLVRYQQSGVASEKLRQHVSQIPLRILERETGLSRHTILRARQGKRVHPRSLQLLKMAVRKVPIGKTLAITTGR